MRVLWITNILFPEATARLKGEKELKGSGGWMLALANALTHTGEVELTVVSVSPSVKELTNVQGESICYYAIPVCGSSDNKKGYESAFRVIKKNLNPDIVHIHGTESSHALVALRVFGADCTLVSLQGIISSIAPYYLGGISPKEVRKNMTFRSLLRPSLMQEQADMKRRGESELLLFKECKYVAGRTTWDKTQVWKSNPDVMYYHSDEVLREEFYSGLWQYSSCRAHTIFASQSAYPLKGLHKLIEAMAIVKRHFPDVQLRVAGQDICYTNSSFFDRLRISSYGRLIRRLIEKHELRDHVFFTGPLNASEMKKEYLGCNVFVCPSSIENSPNSLGEAQLLGVPCVASYVGGIPDMMKGDEEHLYRFEDVGMLAAKICEIFESRDRVDTSRMRESAYKRHDANRVVDDLVKTYTEIVGRNHRI